MSEIKDKSKRRLTATEWAEIIAMAENGTPIADIAAHFDAAKSTIYKGLETRGLSQSDLSKRSKEANDKREHEALVQKIKKTKEDSYTRIEAVERIAMNLVISKQKTAPAGSQPVFSDIESDLKSLERAMGILTKGLNAKWQILGLNRENAEADAPMPELVVRELTQSEIESIRRKQRTESGDLTADDILALEQAAENELNGGDDEEDINAIVEEEMETK